MAFAPGQECICEGTAVPDVGERTRNRIQPCLAGLPMTEKLIDYVWAIGYVTLLKLFDWR